MAIRTLTTLLLGLSLSVAVQARTGEEVYGTACVACHGSGAPGIPQKGDVAAWAPRIAAGMDALYESVINGKNAMPPRGLCMDCTDEELKAAADFIVFQSKGSGE